MHTHINRPGNRKTLFTRFLNFAGCFICWKWSLLESIYSIRIEKGRNERGIRKFESVTAPHLPPHPRPAPEPWVSDGCIRSCTMNVSFAFEWSLRHFLVKKAIILLLNYWKQLCFFFIFSSTCLFNVLDLHYLFYFWNSILCQIVQW